MVKVSPLQLSVSNVGKHDLGVRINWKGYKNHFVPAVHVSAGGLLDNL